MIVACSCRRSSMTTRRTQRSRSQARLVARPGQALQWQVTPMQVFSYHEGMHPSTACYGVSCGPPCALLPRLFLPSAVLSHATCCLCCPGGSESEGVEGQQHFWNQHEDHQLSKRQRTPSGHSPAHMAHPAWYDQHITHLVQFCWPVYIRSPAWMFPAGPRRRRMPMQPRAQHSIP